MEHERISDLTVRAEAGDWKAALVLGRAYRNGEENVPKNSTIAFQYLLKSAEKGFSRDALKELGDLCMEVNDQREAYVYFAMAASLGDKTSSAEMIRIERSESPYDIRQAQRLAMYMLRERAGRMEHSRMEKDRKADTTHPPKEESGRRKDNSGSRRPVTLRLPLTDSHKDQDRTVRIHRGNDGRISLTVQSSHIRHIERFFRRKCMRDLIDLNIYPDVKEISEAEAMRQALVKRLNMHQGSRATAVIVVGDGRTPRLGALLAYTTAWMCVSIDPNFKKTDYPGTQRLDCIKTKIEDPDIGEKIYGSIEYNGMSVNDITRVAVTAPHSHASLETAVKVVRNVFPNMERLDAIAMPCCVRQTLSERETCDDRYEDLGVWSTKNVIQIWKNLPVHPGSGEDHY